VSTKELKLSVPMMEAGELESKINLLESGVKCINPRKVKEEERQKRDMEKGLEPRGMAYDSANFDLLVTIINYAGTATTVASIAKLIFDLIKKSKKENRGVIKIGESMVEDSPTLDVKKIEEIIKSELKEK